MKKILIPTDFSDSARNAVEYAIQLFGTDAEYTLMNSYNEPTSTTSSMISLRDVLAESSEDSLKEELAFLTTEQNRTNLNLNTMSVYGESALAITSTASKLDVDAIVMGTTGASGLKEVLLGSTAAGVVQKADHPVITVPASVAFKEPKRILFASDLRAFEDSRIPDTFIDLAEKFKSSVTILTVQKPNDKVDNTEAESGYEMHVQLGKIDHEFQIIDSDNVEVGITQYAKDYKMDMVVTIPRKGNWFQQLFSPSVSKKLAQHLDVPMMALYLK